MISLNTRQAYSEVDEFIELLDENTKKKIPKKLRELFKREKDDSYIKKINKNIPFKEQNLKEETLAIIALLNLEYLCDDEKEKERLRNLYKENEIKYQNAMKEKYNLNFFKKENEIIEEKDENKIEVIKKEPFYKKIIEKIKKYFNKKSNQ